MEQERRSQQQQEELGTKVIGARHGKLATNKSIGCAMFPLIRTFLLIAPYHATGGGLEVLVLVYVGNKPLIQIFRVKVGEMTKSLDGAKLMWPFTP